MGSLLRLPPLPSIADILRLYQLKAKKHLAQNFLLNERLTNKIVKQTGKLLNSYVIEVGPGPGCITRSIMKHSPKKLIVIEKDKRFLPTLSMLAEAFTIVNGEMHIILDDIMKINYSGLFPEDSKKEWNDKPPNIHIIGNLPFNVSTPLIIKWLKAISEKSGPWSMGRVKMCLTFQKEVAERLVAPSSSSQRCRLSIMAQAFTNPRLRFMISGKSFIPPPKVDVGVVTFEPLQRFRTQHSFDNFEKMTRHIFSFRQKYSRRCVDTLFPPDFEENLTIMMFKLADLDPEMRPFQYEVEDINRLCSAYQYLLEKHPEIKEYNYRSSKQILPNKYTTRIAISEMEDVFPPEYNTSNADSQQDYS